MSITEAITKSLATIAICFAGLGIIYLVGHNYTCVSAMVIVMGLALIWID